MKDSASLRFAALRLIVLIGILTSSAAVFADRLFARRQPVRSEQQVAKSGDSERSNSQKVGTVARTPSGVELVWIPAGQFLLGSKKEDIHRIQYLSEDSKVPVGKDDVWDESNQIKV
ncbi:MAG TPA: hypothetical protein VFV34_19150, partial [Blastocatellia bacterium]|nr:hypothetical protein [Blastocatellia bacterium]